MWSGSEFLTEAYLPFESGLTKYNRELRGSALGVSQQWQVEEGLGAIPILTRSKVANGLWPSSSPYRYVTTFAHTAMAALVKRPLDSFAAGLHHGLDDNCLTAGVLQAAVWPSSPPANEHRLLLTQHTPARLI